ncbi:penicillin-binding protein 1C [Mucilaginibacter ginsenosidivorax]|uniref:peptidoglycan glycosyltransferase n=1 Tax=Mucilaginibacter ginsenosidivorax TaxID=862126 RepID=A0A5B8VTP1_9SPHI|nr:penicillin-binding protein 1C [Mucilaginibacter ginsenosidivorax]QEC74521.1 penicillin-binding protein 1C [Mucilaginibacter ginsenosidivorax]
MQAVLKRIKTYLKRPKVIFLLVFLFVLTVLFWFCLPKPLFKNPTSYVIDDNQGQLLGASIAKDGQWRFPYNDSVPQKFKQCIIAFEDKRFDRHPGFDALAFGRAIKQNISSKKVTSGGSTLTMQVIRLATKHKRNIWSKLLEIFMALRLELTYSKKEILALYTSNAPFGTNVIGLDAASWRYFGRSPDKLSWGEMAAMAVLPNAPSLVHPGKNRQTLLNKRNRLLTRLYKQGVIDSITAELAKLEPVPEKPMPLPSLAPHLLQRFKNDYDAKPMGDTRIRTSIRSGLQQQVNDILEQHHQVLKANDINNIAAIVLDVETGETLAYAGNITHHEDPQMESDVDVIDAPRSPGSTLKPLLYASAMHNGLILPNSLLPDIPTLIAGYHPENFDMGYDGAVPASKALARSLNVPAVKLLQQYKFEKFYDFLHKIGITTLTKPANHYGLSLILGGGENTLWELTGAYADMARVLNHYDKYNGSYDPEDFHNPVYGKQDIKKPDLEKSGLLDAASIYSTFQAMEEVMRPGEEMLWQQFSSSQRVAWKTGTSFGFRDGWAIGVTPRYVVGVWVGNTDGEGRPGLTGINAAAPALFEIFRLLPASKDWFAMPTGEMVKIDVCRQSGYRAGQYCQDIDQVMVPKTGLRAPVCPYHQLIHLSADGQYQVNGNCQPPDQMLNKKWFVLPPSMEYYYKSRNYQYHVLPPFRADCAQAENGNTMEVIYPKDGAKIYIPLEADGTRGRMICNAAHRLPGMKIFWHLDDQYMGTTKDFHQMALNPPPGKHILTLVDGNGNTINIGFEILSK